MKKYNKYLLLSIGFYMLVACQHDEKKQTNAPANVNTRPQVTEQGNVLTFKTNVENVFLTEIAKVSHLTSEFNAPALVEATIRRSQNAPQNIVLFDNPDLADNYSNYISHLNDIKKCKINLARVKDLFSHQAATGKDLTDSEADLADKEAEILEHEVILKSAGIEPDLLLQTKSNMALLMCKVPENQIGNLRKGNPCQLLFNAYPDQVFRGAIQGIADVMDDKSRMFMARIMLANPDGKLRAGMYATVKFGVVEGNLLTVDQNSLVTVQGRTYVFVKENIGLYRRREVSVGQQVNDRVVVFSGVKQGDKVVKAGVMQLKGLSFGY